MAIVLVALAGCSSGRLNPNIDRTRPELGRPGYTQRGNASWYGGKFHGRRTASGEVYDKHGLTAAHRELPLGTWIDVTHLANGRTVRVKVNDRGPFIRGRILDLSRGAAEALGMVNEGVAQIRLRVIAPPGAVPSRRSARRPARTAPARGPFVVQLGAFRDRDRALDLKLALTERFGAIDVVYDDGWHRVRSAPFDHLDDAEALSRRLRTAGHEAVVVPVRAEN